MKKQKDGMPTANIAINKSRLKMYTGDLPTYYLQKGQEFQIELFNPTKDTILCKIYLNSKAIAQGGLVLRPGERVFLERYIDVAKKFKFDTYEVSGTNNEVKKAIEDNGDFKVEFFREIKRRPILKVEPTQIRYKDTSTGNFNDLTRGNNTTINTNYTDSGQPYMGDMTFTTNATNTFDTTSFVDMNQQLGGSNYEATLDWMEPDLSRTISTVDENTTDISNTLRSKPLKAKSSKKIETGRVEEGAVSDQEMTFVNKDWSYFAFHTVEYKLLPISQKINTTQDISVKRYCTSCGAKVKPSWNFCATCSNKL